MRNLKLSVSAEYVNQRIDVFLAGYLNVSRSYIQKLIKSGDVNVNSRIVKPHYKLKEGDCLKISLPEEKNKKVDIIQPEYIPLNILYEDNDIIIVDKPAGIITHPTHKIYSHTLVNMLLGHCKLSQIGAPFRPGIVHRLDKETSGAIVIAKSDKAYWGLIYQFQNKKVDKEYIVIVHGKLHNNEGIINVPIGRPRKGGTGMEIKGRLSRDAITYYRVEKKLGNKYTVLKVKIHTGRTHQIRLHLSYIGHPVIGDKRYSRKKGVFARQALHAYTLGLVHPVTDKYIRVIAPLPEDMKIFIEENEIIMC